MNKFIKPVNSASREAFTIKSPIKVKQPKKSKITVMHIGEIIGDDSPTNMIGLCIGGCNYELMDYLKEIGLATWISKKSIDNTFHRRTNESNAVNQVNFENVPEFITRAMGPDMRSFSFKACSFEQIINNTLLLKYQNDIESILTIIFDLPDQILIVNGVPIQFDVVYVKVI